MTADDDRIALGRFALLCLARALIRVGDAFLCLAEAIAAFAEGCNRAARRLAERARR